MKAGALKKQDVVSSVVSRQAEIHVFPPRLTVTETMTAETGESLSCDYEEFLSQYGRGVTSDFA